MSNPKLAALLVAAGAATLAASFWLLRPAPESVAVVTAPALPAPPPAAQTFAIEIRQNRRTVGPEVIRLRRNEMLRLTFLSDQDDELHLHGYDLHLHLHANQPATLSFRAQHSGRFEYELHKAHIALGTLEVLPE